MLLKNFLLIVFLLATGLLSYGQNYKLFGKVTNTKLEPVAFASVQVNGFKTGVLTKEDGTFTLPLYNGVYEVSFTMIGYKPQVVKMVINKEDYEQNIILVESGQALEGVVIRSKYKDKAEAYIRQIIRHKDFIQNAAGSYACDVYIKAIQEDSAAIKPKKAKNKANTKNTPADSLKNIYANTALAEIAIKLYRQLPNKQKEERTGVKMRGAVSNLFYLTTTDGSFDLYDNLMRVPAVSPTPFLSPISYSGLIAYKYKTVNIQKIGNHNIYTIEFKPGALSNATVSGWVMVDDSAWVILQSHFSLPAYHLPEYDYFAVDQQYQFVNNTAWLPVKQQFNYYSKSRSKKLSGTTTASFNNYKLNKEFEKKFFGAEVSAATEAAYKRDSSFWGSVRTVPLTAKEISFIKFKDSIYAYVHSKAYLDSMDRVANKVTWKKILYQSQTLQNHEKGTNFVFPSIAAMTLPYVVSYGGLRLGLPFSFYKNHPLTHKTISFRTDINYGFLNKDVNGGVYFSRRYNAFNQATFHFHAGRNFAQIFLGDAWINQIRRNNYYLNNEIGGGWEREIVNGLFVKASLDVAFRRSLENYKTYNFMDSLIIRDLGEADNKPPVFDPYNALYGSLELSYTPFQPYIREPNQKIILESKWPTAYVQWRKGIPNIFKSEVNFDYLEMGLRQTLRLGTLGIMGYTVKTGSFLNTKELKYVDYKFQRRGDPWLFMNPNYAFQALDSTFPVFKRFYEGHVFHEFNGALLNKVPLLKKLGLREVAGAGFLVTAERNLKYAEVFTGIERVFKLPFNFFSKFKLGVYAVSSVANKFSNPVQFKIGITGWDNIKNTWR